jgi:uncharacterized protein (DUF362 family)
VPHLVRAREVVSAVLELAEKEGAEIVVVDRDGCRPRRAARRLLRRAGDRVLVVAA